MHQLQEEEVVMEMEIPSLPLRHPLLGVVVVQEYKHKEQSQAEVQEVQLLEQEHLQEVQEHEQRQQKQAQDKLKQGWDTGSEKNSKELCQAQTLQVLPLRISILGP
eukprot:Pompholyxophrys_punicea_v1_NODE_978_length_1077_cov_4.106654.p3 type:complete len:106 gc:universal NODE_978_length_1077_cov_4.106654:690-373(-)